MEMHYNEAYYRNDFGSVPYQDHAFWTQQFSSVAEHIVSELSPGTVLDAGCAFGYLVEVLRDRGVEAYGVDISEYAISQVRQDIRPFCAVGSLTEELPAALPRHYDLVVTIEVLEHLSAADGAAAIHNLCSLADRVLFSSTAEDIMEATHVNVQQREYWAELFAREGFFRDLYYDGQWLTDSTMLFVRRAQTSVADLVADYEHSIRREKALSGCVVSKIYFDIGRDLNEEDSIKLSGIQNSTNHWRFSIPAGCRHIRFDPVEGMGCLVGSLRCRCTGAILEPGSHNGIFLDNIWIFRTSDPWIMFDLPDDYQYWVELDVDIVALSQTDWVSLCQSIEKLQSEFGKLSIIRDTLESEKYNYELSTRTLEDQNGRLEAENLSLKEHERSLLAEKQALELDVIRFENDITKLNEEIGRLEDEIPAQLNQKLRKKSEEAEALLSELRGKLEHREAELNAAIQNASVLRQELEQSIAAEARSHQEAVLYADTLNAVRSSTAWRITRPLRQIMDRLRGQKTADPAPVQATPLTARSQPQAQVISPSEEKKVVPASSIISTYHPVEPIACVLVPGKVKRLNLVTDTLNSSSLLGGVATALILATEFCRRYGYELRIITRQTDVDGKNYADILSQNGLSPLERVSFYSDVQRNTDDFRFKMELNEGDIFFATSWWSCAAIEATCAPKRYFYILQEVESFFYNYGPEHFLCSQFMHSNKIDYLVNSHFLFDYFRTYEPAIVARGCYFEPAFSNLLYQPKAFEKKERYKLFFYSRPNNPRNLFSVGVQLLDAAIQRGILDTNKWDICFVGQDTPKVAFCDGSESLNMGQLSWTEYANFLKDVDLGLCLMYTPHPSYPPYDVACSGGVVLSNKMYNKVDFPDCANVIMADLEKESFMKSFAEAIELAGDPERRKANYERSTIARDWQKTLESTLDYMGRCLENV